MLLAALMLMACVGLLSMASQSQRAFDPDALTPTAIAQASPTITPDTPTNYALTNEPQTALALGTPTPTLLAMGPQRPTAEATAEVGGVFPTPDFGGAYPVEPDEEFPPLPAFPTQGSTFPVLPTIPAGTGSRPVVPTPPSRPTSATFPNPSDPPGGNYPMPEPTNIPAATFAPPATQAPGRATATPEREDPDEETLEPTPTFIDPDQPIDPDLTTEPTPFLPLPTLDIPTPEPTTPPVDTLTGQIRWTLAQSPVILGRETIISSGSSVTIDPGVEVRLATGVSLVVDGTLNTNGTPGSRVRFGASSGRWGSLVVNPGGVINLNGAEIRGAGAGGVAIAAFGGSATIADSLIEQSGQIYGGGGSISLLRSQVSGVAPVSISVPIGGAATLVGNSIVNTATDGSSAVTINTSSPDARVDIRSNRISGSSGVNLLGQFDAPHGATIHCNTFQGGSIGLLIKTRTPTLDGSRITIRDNAFLSHRSYGLAADVLVDGRNNWWGHANGPYHPQQNASGTGDAVGVNIPFQPWLTAPPACAP